MKPIAEELKSLRNKVAELEKAKEDSKDAEGMVRDEKYRHLKVLNDFAQITTKILNPEELCDKVLELILEQMPCDAFLVCLYNKNNDKVWPIRVYDTFEGLLTRLPVSGEPKSPASFTSEILTSNGPILVHRGEEDLKDVDYMAYGNIKRLSRSLIFVPLKNEHDEVFGMLSVQSYQFNAYTEEHSNLLLSIAGHFSPALTSAIANEKARKAKFEERRFGDKLAALVETINDLSLAETFDDLCRRSIKLGKERLGFDRLALFFFSEDEKVARGSFAISKDGEIKDRRDIAFDISSASIMSELSLENPLAFREGASLWEAGDKVGMGTIIGAGIRDRDKIIGCLVSDNLISQEPISKYQQELLRLYASSVGSLCASKKREEELKEAHQIYCEAIDNTRGVPYRLNYITGQYELVGEGCERLLGIPAKELTAMKFRELVSQNIPTEEVLPDDPHERDKLFRRGDLKRYRADIQIRTPNGEEKWLTDCSVPIRNESGEIVGSLGILQDITDRKQPEVELKKVHKDYCDAIENAHGVPYRINYQTDQYEFVGMGCYKLLGVEANGLTAPLFRELVVENIPTDVGSPIDPNERAKAFLRGEIQRYRADLKIRTPQGKTKWVADCSVPIRDEKTGQIIGSLGILQDITERKNQEQELKKAHQFYYEAIENAKGVPYRLNYKTGQYDFVGESCERLLGIPANELTAEKLRTIIKENIPTDLSAPRDPKERDRAFRSGEMGSYRADMRIRMESGEEKWLTDCSVPIRDKQTAEIVGSLGILQDITERKQQEEQLRRAHQAYCEAIDNAQGVPYRLDYVTGQYEFVGEGCERILGIPSDELTAKKFREMVKLNIPTNDQEPVNPYQRDEEFRAGQIKRYRADILIMTPQGEEKWLTDCSVPIRDEKTGEISKSLGILQDITERKHQEEELRQAHRAYCEAIDNAQGVPYRLNYKTGQYEFVGEGCERILGIPSKELTAQRFREMVKLNIPTNEEQEKDPYVRDRDFRKGHLKRYRADILMETPQGEEKWLTDCSVPIHDEKTGEIVGSLGILQDITDRKLQEEKLRWAHQAYCEAIDNAQGVPYRLNYETGQYDFVGEGCERILGIPSHELTAKKFREMVKENVPTEEDFPSDAMVRDKMFRKGRMKRYKADVHLFIPKGEEKWLTDCSVPIPNERTGEIVGSLGILIDITDRKRAEETLRSASRMEATTTLAGGVAHDFNNLMVAVLGNAELLRMQYDDEEDAMDMLDNISQAAQRAGDLAQQMLAFARGGKYQPKVLNLNESVRETLQLQASAFPPRIETRKDVQNDLWNIEADPAQMNQIIMNLCLNGVEAMEGNGTLAITTRNIEISPEDSRSFHNLRPGRYVCLAVQDTGRGMDTETMSKVFEPFYTTKFQGRGLGLAAVYGIVQNHGGEIIPYSETGNGTTFKVYLPATVHEIQKAAETGIESISGTETIMIIDDEEAVLDVTRRILERLGYKVLIAKHGMEAVKLAEEYPDSIHLALLDMGMPMMGGAECYPLLKNLRPDLEVIICSGYELDASSKELIDFGAHSFLQKPFQARVLGREIRNALESQK